MVAIPLPSSPRRRRRLAWGAVAAGLVATVVTIILLLPKSHRIPETFSGKAQVAQTTHYRLTPAERRSAQQTVDRFVRAALDRSDPRTAWELSGPDLRGTSTVADWLAGQMPITDFPARGRTFHGWTLLDVGKNEIQFTVLIQPRSTKLGATSFSVQLIRRGTGWLVNRWYPAAVFSPTGTNNPHIVGPNDFGASGPAPTGAGREAQPNAGGSRVGAVVLAVPLTLFGLGFLAVMVMVGRNWLRYRRMRKEVAARRTEE